MVMIKDENNKKKTNHKTLSREELRDKLIRETINDNHEALKRLSQT